MKRFVSLFTTENEKTEERKRRKQNDRIVDFIPFIRPAVPRLVLQIHLHNLSDELRETINMLPFLLNETRK